MEDSGVDQEACCGGRAEGADRAAAGDLADDGDPGGGLAGSAPGMGCAFSPGATSFTVFEPRVRALLAEMADMPATVLAERVGWTGSIRWFRDNVKRLRPEHRPVDPGGSDRLVCW